MYVCLAELNTHVYMPLYTCTYELFAVCLNVCVRSVRASQTEKTKSASLASLKQTQSLESNHPGKSGSVQWAADSYDHQLVRSQPVKLATQLCSKEMEGGEAEGGQKYSLFSSSGFVEDAVATVNIHNNRVDENKWPCSSLGGRRGLTLNAVRLPPFSSADNSRTTTPKENSRNERGEVNQTERERERKSNKMGKGSKIAQRFY